MSRSSVNKISHIFSLHYIISYDLLIAATLKAHSSGLITTSCVNQLDNNAADNVIIRCVDNGPSNDRTDNYSISSHHQVIGRRRCRYKCKLSRHMVVFRAAQETGPPLPWVYWTSCCLYKTRRFLLWRCPLLSAPHIPNFN